MKNEAEELPREKWARFRFSVIAPLLAAPPGKGEVRAALRELVERTFRHPVTGKPVRFGFSTLERWYHKARQSTDPVGELRSGRAPESEHSATPADPKVLRGASELELSASPRQPARARGE